MDQAGKIPSGPHGARWALWLAGYLLAVALVIGPVWTRAAPSIPMAPASSELEPEAGDPLYALWWIDWVWRHPGGVLAGEAHDPDVFFPFGLDLRLLLSFQNLLLLCLKPLGSAVLAYNICWVLAVLFAALASAALAFEVSGSAPGAFAAGLLVAFGPSFYLHSLEHVYKLLAFGWLPLLLLFLYRALHKGGAAAYLGTLGCALLILASDWYNALYAVLAAAVVWLAWAVASGSTRRARATALLVLMLPLLGAFLWWALGSVLADRPDLLVGSRAARVRNSADLLNVLLPHPYHAVWGGWSALRLQSLPGSLIEKTAFFGWVLPLLLGWGVWWQRRDRRLWPWLSIAAVFVVLSFGPHLQWGGEPIVRLPGFWLQDLPGFRGDRAPGRYVTVTYLALGVVLALLISRLPRPPRAAAAVALVMAVEFAPFATPSVPLRDSAVLRSIGRSPGSGTVLDVPFRIGVPRYLFDQTLHRRPVVTGHMVRLTPRHMRHPADIPDFGLFRDPAQAPLPVDHQGLSWALQELLKVEHVVIHKRLLPEWERGLGRLLSSGLRLELLGEDDDVVALRLGREPSPAIPQERQMTAGTEPFYSRALMLGWGGGAGEGGPFLWGRGRWQALALAPPLGARSIGLEVLPYVGTVKRRPQQLTLGVGRQAKTFELRPGWQEVEYPVPEAREGPWRLVFRVEQTGRPSELEPGSRDRRPLGVALRRIRWID